MNVSDSAVLVTQVGKGKYILQAFRGPPPGPSGSDAAACASWMRQQCAVAVNES